jgi:hypothetical protein
MSRRIRVPHPFPVLGKGAGFAFFLLACGEMTQSRRITQDAADFGFKATRFGPRTAEPFNRALSLLCPILDLEVPDARKRAVVGNQDHI